VLQEVFLRYTLVFLRLTSPQRQVTSRDVRQ